MSKIMASHALESSTVLKIFTFLEFSNMAVSLIVFYKLLITYAHEINAMQMFKVRIVISLATSSLRYSGIWIRGRVTEYMLIFLNLHFLKSDEFSIVSAEFMKTMCKSSEFFSPESGLY